MISHESTKEELKDYFDIIYYFSDKEMSLSDETVWCLTCLRILII